VPALAVDEPRFGAGSVLDEVVQPDAYVLEATDFTEAAGLEPESFLERHLDALQDRLLQNRNLVLVGEVESDIGADLPRAHDGDLGQVSGPLDVGQKLLLRVFQSLQQIPQLLGERNRLKMFT